MVVCKESLETIMVGESSFKKRVVSQVRLKKHTLDSIKILKELNGYSSISDTINALIVAVNMDSIVNDEIYRKSLGREQKSNTKGVEIRGTVFSSVKSASEFYGITENTVRNRIKNVSNIGLRNWNYIGEDLNEKYS